MLKEDGVIEQKIYFTLDDVDYLVMTYEGKTELFEVIETYDDEEVRAEQLVEFVTTCEREAR